MFKINIKQNTLTAWKARETKGSQLNRQIDIVIERWERTMARTSKEILNETLIGDATKSLFPQKPNLFKKGKTPTKQTVPRNSLQISVYEYGSGITCTNSTNAIDGLGQITAKRMFDIKRSALESRIKIAWNALVSQASEFNARGVNSKGDIIKDQIHNILDLIKITKLIAKDGGKTFGGKYKVLIPHEINKNILLHDPYSQIYHECVKNTNSTHETSNNVNLLNLAFKVQQFYDKTDMNFIKIAKDGGKIAPILIYSQNSFEVVEPNFTKRGCWPIEMFFNLSNSSSQIGWYMNKFGIKVINPQHVFVYWASLEPTLGDKTKGN